MRLVRQGKKSYAGLSFEKLQALCKNRRINFDKRHSDVGLVKKLEADDDEKERKKEEKKKQTTKKRKK